MQRKGCLEQSSSGGAGVCSLRGRSSNRHLLDGEEGLLLAAHGGRASPRHVARPAQWRAAFDEDVVGHVYRP